MTHTNAEIAAFIDANKTRAGWWEILCEKGHATEIKPYLTYPNYCRRCGYNYQNEECSKGDYTGPDFAADAIACFKELEPPLLAMDAHVHRYNHKDGSCVVWMGEWISDPDPLKDNPYSAAVSTAFSWAMDNQPEALRRACEEVNHD